MADSNNTSTGKVITITSILAVLLTLGASTLYDHIDWSKKVYYCKNKVDLGPQYCVRFSTSGLRCYPSMNNNTGYKDCSIGWTELTKGSEIPTENINTGTSTLQVGTSSKEICSPVPDYGCKAVEE